LIWQKNELHPTTFFFINQKRLRLRNIDML
jgi:hypothetical protein